MNVLAIFMEPAPYQTALVRELMSRWDGKIDILFVGRNMTQNWGVEFDDARISFLSDRTSFAVREIWHRLGRRNYDLLHVNGWGDPVLLCAMLIAGLRHIPIVCETDTHGRRNQSLPRRVLKRLLYPLLFSLPAMFLPGGSAQAAYLEHYGVPAHRMKRAGMTSDVTKIKKFASNMHASDRTEWRRRIGISTSVLFLYLGRLESFKGLQDLFDAWLSLRCQRADIALAIAGSGSLQDFVREAAASIRGVHYLGHLLGERVWEAYCASDVFVLPSRFEPWGLVINEAMAAGLPVIVSDAAGCIDDLVRSCENGLTYPAGDTAALSRHMRQLADDAALRSRMELAGADLISNWTLEAEALVVTSAWREVLA